MDVVQRLKSSLLVLACISVPMTADATTGSLEKLLELPLEDLVQVRVGVASHFVEPQLNSGSTVSVIHEAQWQKRGARRLMDAIGYLPGTIVLPNWFSAQQIMIRGYANGNNSGGITTLWDGVPVSSAEGSPQFNRQFINLGTLNRIEMIRGPGSALHGENAFHGVFSMHAFESPTDVTRFDVYSATNTYSHAGAKHSQALGKDGLRMHVSAAYTNQGDQHRAYDYFDPPGSSERAFEYRSTTAVLKLTSDPNRTFTWNAGLYWDDINSDGFLSGGTSGAGGLDERDLGGVDSDIIIARGGAGYKINDTTEVEAMAYYWTYDRTYTRAVSLTRDLEGTGGAHDMGAKFIVKQRKLFGNTQWSGALDLRHQQMDSAHRKITDIDTGEIVVEDDLQFNDFGRDIYSVSLDANTGLMSERVRLRYGVRVDEYSDFGTQTTPRFGIIYHATQQSAIKLLYGEGFRAPNALEVNGSATIEGNADIKPETISTYELVYMLQTPRTLSEFVLFKSHWKNSIINTSTTTSGFNSRFINSGDNKAHGAEASFTLQGDPWTVATSGSYVRSENTTLNQDYMAFPTWILNAGIGYRLEQYDTDFFVNVRAHLDAAEGQITSDYPNPADLKDYWRTDVHAAKHFSKNATLTLDIRNLFDRKNYLPSIQANPSPGGIPDEELSLKIGISYRL
jgi:iron complex outermembrane receptor protein